MTISGHISACITSFDHYRIFRAGMTTLRSRCQVSVNCTEMVHNVTICPTIAWYVHLCLNQRSSFCTLLKSEDWIGYVRLSTTKICRHVWSRIWSMIDFDHIEAEVGNLGLRFLVMGGTAFWNKIKQIWPKVALNGPIYILVARYDNFRPY